MEFTWDCKDIYYKYDYSGEVEKLEYVLFVSQEGEQIIHYTDGRIFTPWGEKPNLSWQMDLQFDKENNWTLRKLVTFKF